MFSCLSWGQELNNPNGLPPCPQDQNVRYHNCWGKYIFSNGDKFVGEWKDGKKNGQGTFYWIGDSQWKGDKYVGEYKDDRRNGQGTYSFSNGDKYVGEWKDNNRTGQGIYTYADGKRQEGIWENSNFIREAKVNLPNPSNNRVTNADRSTMPTCPQLDYSKAYDLGIGGKTEKWTNCSGRFDNKGEVLEGEWLNGLLHGRGTYIFSNGDKYVGEFKEGKKHGRGIFYHLEDDQWKGDKYVGDYKDDKRSGQGTYTYAGGDKYVGEYRDGRPNGQGTYTHAGGNKYVGEFKDGNKHGQGTFYYQENDQWKGDKYVGEYKDNKRNGQGTYTFADGRKQEGIWENGKFIREAKANPSNFNDNNVTSTGRSGFPPCPKPDYSKSYDVGVGGKTEKWTNCSGKFENKGEVLEGEWLNGLLHGQGKYTYNNGHKYVGELNAGNKVGQGTYTWSNGDKYVGEFKEDKMSGQGTYYFLAENQWKGSKHVGQYSDGKKNGPGTFTTSSGDKYVGDFKNDNYNGQGTYTFADGRKLEGIWENGNLVRDTNANVETEKNQASNDIKPDANRELKREKIITSRERKLVEKKIPPAPSPAPQKQNGDFR
jgi:hypothetical protein